MNSRLVKGFCSIAVLALAGALVLMVGQKPVPVQGASDDTEARGLHGTWDVTLKFPVCSTTCPCPGGVPNIPIRALHEYQKGGTLAEVPGGTLFRGPGVGSWERVDEDPFAARLKFFVFKSDGSGLPAANEVVTSHITLTGPESFTAAATFDLFSPSGIVIAQGCAINETGTRFPEP